MATIFGLMFIMASLERACAGDGDGVSMALVHMRAEDKPIRWLGSRPAQAFSREDAFDAPTPDWSERRGDSELWSDEQQQQRSALGAAAAAQFHGVQQQQRSALGAAAAAQYSRSSSSSAGLTAWQRSRPGSTSQLSARLDGACTERAAWSVRRLHRMRGSQFACNHRRRRE